MMKERCYWAGIVTVVSMRVLVLRIGSTMFGILIGALGVVSLVTAWILFENHESDFGMKRKLEIYKKYNEGIKTGTLIKTYNISRQRIHQILNSLKKNEKNKKGISINVIFPILEKAGYEIIIKKKEVWYEIFYNTNSNSCNSFDSNNEFCYE